MPCMPLQASVVSFAVGSETKVFFGFFQPIGSIGLGTIFVHGWHRVDDNLPPMPERTPVCFKLFRPANE
jgi:hypothetical protein